MADPTPAKALLLALTRCDRLSPERQAELHAIGQTLAHPQSNGAVNDQIRAFVQQDPRLQTYYTEAYDYLQADYQTQERAKGFDFAVPTGWEFTLDHLIQTFNATNSITSARQVLSTVKRPAEEAFWDKSDRLVVFLMGGAFLGSAIGQFFGAIVAGAILGVAIAGCYGWYISFGKPKTKGSPR
jgi:hypothetical protein